jgi:hypothetical protein
MGAGGRTALLIGGAVVAALLAGACKGGEKDAAKAKEAVEKSGDIAKAEDDLLARRDRLVKARQRIREERDKLEERRRAAVAAGGDVSEIEDAQAKLVGEERGLLSEEDKLNVRYREIIRERRELVDTLASAGGGAAASVASREKSIAGREKEIAALAAKLAEREAGLAEREAAFAKREAQMCGVASQPTTIIQTVDAKGAKYTKKDVEPLLKKARKDMSRKGIRRSDLPSPALDLEKESTAAMAEGDYGRARFAASQLVGTVRSIKINKAFIQAKISRLNASMKGKKLSSGTQSQVDKLFREATSNYGDGKFKSANRRLNKIYSVIN